MPIDDIGNDSNDEIKWTIPKGKRVNSFNTHANLLGQLTDNGRGWFILKASDYPRGIIRADQYTLLFDSKFNSMRQAYSGSGDYIYVFQRSRPIISNNSGGGGGSSNSSSASGSLDNSVLGEMSGMVKQLANDLARKNAAMAADWMGLSLKPKEDGTKRTFEDDGKEIFRPNTESEKIGAQKARDSAAAAMAVSGIMMITSKGKSLFKDPDTLKTIKQGYTRLLKGKKVEMPDVPIKEVSYKKRSTKETKKLHGQSTTAKKQFRKDLANDPKMVKQMKKNGISDADIKNMKDKGLTPKSYEVHHKLPLDDGGTNDKSNLILTKKSPYHSAFTAEQKTLTGHLKEGETATINFPVPKGSIYPVK